MGQSLNQFLTTHFVKKVTKLMLISISLFSFFFSSYSTLSYCFFLNSFSSHSPKFSFMLLNHAMDKNCIFLICNGIVVFLAKSSGFFIRFSPHRNELNDPLLNKIGDRKDLSSSLETNDLLLERAVSVDEEDEEEQQQQEEQNTRLITAAVEEEEEGAVQIIEEEENELGAIGFVMKEEEGGGGGGEGGGGENGLEISTEELNKKCDEFIRRVKEEIRMGAQEQS